MYEWNYPISEFFFLSLFTPLFFLSPSFFLIFAFFLSHSRFSPLLLPHFLFQYNFYLSLPVWRISFYISLFIISNCSFNAFYFLFFITNHRLHLTFSNFLVLILSSYPLIHFKIILMWCSAGTGGASNMRAFTPEQESGAKKIISLSKKSHYECLGISKGANDGEIKKAYRWEVEAVDGLIKENNKRRRRRRRKRRSMRRRRKRRRRRWRRRRNFVMWRVRKCKQKW